MNGEEAGTRASREAAFEQAVARDLRRNYAAHLAHGLLGQTGFRLVQAPTFIPAYVHMLSGSDLVVGLARGCQAFGMFLSPILGATFIEHRRRVLPVGIRVGLVMRLQLLGIALAGFLLSERSNLVAICLFLGLFGFFLGMQGVIFNFLVAKVIPVSRRGVLLGLRNAIAGVSAAAVAKLGGHFLDANTLGNGYATTFLLAFALTVLGLFALLAVREPASPEVRAQASVPERLRQLPELLRADRAFTRYFLARALATMGRMAVPFYVLFADARSPLSGDDLGNLTAAFLLAQTTTNAVWGLVADRFGFRLIFLASLGLWMLATLILLESGSAGPPLFVFVALGAGLGGFLLSSQNLALEFGSRENLPMRIAVANSAAELVGAVGPIAGGLLASLYGYATVFWTSLVFLALAFAVVLASVPEPRRRGADAPVS